MTTPNYTNNSTFIFPSDNIQNKTENTKSFKKLDNIYAKGKLVTLD